jgi:outer membrane biosynthesis protein TonB
MTPPVVNIGHSDWKWRVNRVAGVLLCAVFVCGCGARKVANAARPSVPPSPSIRTDTPPASSKPLSSPTQSVQTIGSVKEPNLPSSKALGPGDGFKILSPTLGIDFRPYIMRLLSRVKSNWYAVMPQAAYVGEKGSVAIVFTVLPNGSIAEPGPSVETASGGEPLRDAAVKAIRASAPFEPLPDHFHGPFLRLRLLFLYSIKPDSIQQLGRE